MVVVLLPASREQTLVLHSPQCTGAAAPQRRLVQAEGEKPSFLRGPALDFRDLFFLKLLEVSPEEF